MIDSDEKELDSFISFFGAKKAISKLCATYSYLDYFVHCIELTIATSEGVLTKKNILMYLRDYINSNFDKADRCVLLDKVLQKSLNL